MTNTFYRDKSRGHVGGVCAGLADYFGVSPAFLRLVFVLWTISGGAGVLAYIILWIILPDKSTLDLAHDEAVRHNVQEIGAEARGLGQDLQGIFGGKGGSGPAGSRRLMLLGGLVVLTGLVLLAENLHLLWWFRLDQLWPVALILAGVVLLNRALRSKG